MQCILCDTTENVNEANASVNPVVRVTTVLVCTAFTAQLSLAMPSWIGAFSRPSCKSWRVIHEGFLSPAFCSAYPRIISNY